MRDIANIPIVTKNDLRLAGAAWKPQMKSKYRGNTGGTSGSPLGFFLSKEILDKESFFINDIFKSTGWKRADDRLVFRGLNVLDSNSVKFVIGEDAYLINLYRSFSDMHDDLENFFQKNKIKYFHGYPSAIYQFAVYCSQYENRELLSKIKKHLNGVLLGSEFPAQAYRDVIERVFNVRSISWYGHSEMTVLAPERVEPYVYYPYQTYGFCEALPSEEGITRMIGTSFHHLDTPFVRYDTEDSIDVISSEQGLLESFSIANGRIGEYILDRGNYPVSLTAFIFGRHHKAFDFADFIQVSQDVPGVATLHVSIPKESLNIDLNEILKAFDLSNIDVSFTVFHLEHPFRTKNGKVPLLIPSKHVI